MLKEKHFQYSHELVKWVNAHLSQKDIFNITSKGMHGGEGYVLFYWVDNKVPTKEILRT